jgi:hypothetical protein
MIQSKDKAMRSLDINLIATFPACQAYLETKSIHALVNQQW